MKIRRENLKKHVPRSDQEQPQGLVEAPAGHSWRWDLLDRDSRFGVLSDGAELERALRSGGGSSLLRK